MTDISLLLEQELQQTHYGKWHNAAAASQKYGKQTTTTQPQQYLGAISVLNKLLIPRLLKLANEYDFHLHPVSTNNNWGYSSIDTGSLSKPVVLLDLGTLKSILPTSKELGLVTIEPGVTQQELHDYLQQQNWPYMVPVTGAGPNCSIVSNALERGYGITPHTDHFYACNALKAYLPHPELCESEYQSAVSELDTSGEDFIDKTFKWGMGPYTDGLFTQSNLGIVTEMTVRLAKRPDYFCAFYIQVHNTEHFKETVYFIRSLLQSYSGLVGSINLMDKRRLVSMTSKNPNVGDVVCAPLTDEQVNKLAKEKHLPEWMVVGSIYGDKTLVSAVKKAIRGKAKGLGRIIFSDSLLLKAAKSLSQLPLGFIPLFRELTKQLSSLEEGIEIMLGVPNQVALPLPYWVNKNVSGDKSNTLHPANDGCGLLWYAPLIKMDPDTLLTFISFVRNTMLNYQIDPFITFTNLRHDCIDSTVPIVFDLTDEKATVNAHNCLTELINEGCKLGFVPYRLPIKSQQQLNKNTPYWQTVKTIKQAIDPNSVLTPGKYDHNVPGS